LKSGATLRDPITIRNLMIKVILVGDYNEVVLAHRCIPAALKLTGKQVTAEWLPTSEIESTSIIAERNPAAIWCVPGSPYNNMEGALTAVRYARENKLSFLGTCGGFQHALIEFARNVLNIAEADHAESNPASNVAVVSKLSCALINQFEAIFLAKNSRLREIYNADQILESYQCSYGVNPQFQNRLEHPSLKFTAFGADKAIRAFELEDHPFFIATLFQPERSAQSNKRHPLITAFVEAASL
jgi:CTP synthase (UTP-ammonia lyase)